MDTPPEDDIIKMFDGEKLEGVVRRPKMNVKEAGDYLRVLLDDTINRNADEPMRGLRRSTIKSLTDRGGHDWEKVETAARYLHAYDELNVQGTFQDPIWCLMAWPFGAAKEEHDDEYEEKARHKGWTNEDGTRWVKPRFPKSLQFAGLREAPVDPNNLHKKKKRKR